MLIFRFTLLFCVSPSAFLFALLRRNTVQSYSTSIHPLLEPSVLAPVPPPEKPVCSDWTALTGLSRPRPHIYMSALPLPHYGQCSWKVSTALVLFPCLFYSSSCAMHSGSTASHFKLLFATHYLFVEVYATKCKSGESSAACCI